MRILSDRSKGRDSQYSKYDRGLLGVSIYGSVKMGAILR